MCLFIISEFCFFFSFFWAFFHSSLNPGVEIVHWPPYGINPVNPYEVPLLNTIILLSRGATITWAHRAICRSDYREVMYGVAITVFLGILFSALQITEYIYCSFTLQDSVYGRVFYLSTGFHGLHVLAGTFFIFLIGVRQWLGHFSEGHHFGFEARA